MKVHTLPTGYLFVDDYSKGPLETLSIGDYGKRFNVKADFLGYNRPLNGVPNVPCMPLSEKWVITLSTQYGCPMKCTFCDVPKVEWGGNATVDDLRQQFYSAIRLFPTAKYTDRLNIHFARMGEPSLNPSVLEFTKWLHNNKRDFQAETGLRAEVIHPVLTTSSPRKFRGLRERLLEWCEIKNELYRGQAGLQFSINSTDDEQRDRMFSGLALPLHEIAEMAAGLPHPIGRKYCLNFAFSSDYVIDAPRLRGMFNPEAFMVKITPIHNNNACAANGIVTVGGYDSFAPYAKAESDLKAAGFDVLVFVPSIDEEDGLVTCGNVVLGGSRLRTDAENVNIEGQH